MDHNQKMKIDERVAEQHDMHIVHPKGMLGKQFPSWNYFWGSLNGQHKLWYRLEGIQKATQKGSIYHVKCYLCKSQLLVQRTIGDSRLSLKVIHVDPKHNHTFRDLPNERSKERRTQLNELFLIHKSFSLLSAYDECTCNLDNILILEHEIYSLSPSAVSDRLGKYQIRYLLSQDQTLISQRTFKFGVKTQKELQLIAVLFGLCDCYCNGIRIVSMYCSLDIAKLFGNSWQGSIIADKLDSSNRNKFRIVKELANRFEKIAFIGEEAKNPEERRAMKTDKKNNDQIRNEPIKFTFVKAGEEEFQGFN